MKFSKAQRKQMSKEWHDNMTAYWGKGSHRIMLDRHARHKAAVQKRKKRKKHERNNRSK